MNNSCTDYLFSLDVLKEANELSNDAPELTPEYLTMLRHPGVPPHQLTLKENSICAIQRNLSIKKELVHNVRVHIINIHHHFMEVQLLNDESTHCILHISFNFSPPKSDWTVTRCQFPLHLAYATTFNGCQGLTLGRTVLDLHVDPFTHRQLYTALSRVRRKEDTLLMLTNEENLSTNIIYCTLLLH